MEKFTNKYNFMLYESLEKQLKNKLDNTFLNLKIDILNLVEKSNKNEDLTEAKKFINEYIQNPVIEKIDGFSNTSEIYNFYLKYQNDIDDLCLNKNFYKQIPSNLNIKSLYDYIIEGTKFSILEIFKIIHQEIEKAV